jgi:hypothetical protein
MERTISTADGGTWEKRLVVAATHQSWALLDPMILEEDPDVDSTVFTIFTASDDPEVRVTLHLTEPPSSSYVQLRTNVAVHVKPAMLAANNRGLLLIHRVVANVCDPPLTSYEDNLFIYKSRPEPAMGRLWLLP